MLKQTSERITLDKHQLHLFQFNIESVT